MAQTGRYRPPLDEEDVLDENEYANCEHEPLRAYPVAYEDPPDAVQAWHKLKPLFAGYLVVSIIGVFPVSLLPSGYPFLPSLLGIVASSINVSNCVRQAFAPTIRAVFVLATISFATNCIFYIISLAVTARMRRSPNYHSPENVVSFELFKAAWFLIFGATSGFVVIRLRRVVRMLDPISTGATSL